MYFHDDYMVREVVPFGEENAVSTKRLMEIWNVSERDVREIIRDARRCGIYICASNNGYYQAKTEEEKLNFYRRQRGRALDMLSTLKELRKILLTNPDQLNIDSLNRDAKAEDDAMRQIEDGEQLSLFTIRNTSNVNRNGMI